MNESYIIGAYWGSRAESLFQVRDRVLLTLLRLALVDEQFSTWYEQGMSRKKALENKLDLTEERIEKLCRKAVKRSELDDLLFAKYGFIFGLWTGHADDESSSVSFTVGGTFTVKGISNCCYITVPDEGAARDRLVQLNVAKQLMEILVDVWSPDYAVFISDTVRDKLDVGSRLGIVTYHKVLKNTPKNLDNVCVESTANGFWLSPCDDNYQEDVYLDSLKSVRKLIEW
jgi:hypothetical protein